MLAWPLLRAREIPQDFACEANSEQSAGWPVVELGGVWVLVGGQDDVGAQMLDQAREFKPAGESTRVRALPILRVEPSLDRLRNRIQVKHDADFT